VQGYCLTHGGCAAQQQLWLSLHLLGSAITIIAAIIVDALTMGDNVPTFGNNQGKKEMRDKITILPLKLYLGGFRDIIIILLATPDT